MKTLGALAVGLGTLALAGCGDNADCDYSVPGRICTIAGHHYFEGDSGYSGDGGPALDAQMSLPMDITVAPNGELFIADWNAHRIRRLSADGIIHFVAGNGELGGNIDDPAVGA